MHQHPAPGPGPVCLIAVLMVALSGLAAAPAGARPANPPAERLVLLPGGSAPEAVPTLRVLESNEAGLLLEFELPALDRVQLEASGLTFDVLAIPGGGFAGETGEPMLPTFSRYVQIPDRSGVQVELLDAETLELADLQVFPMQGPDGTGFAYDLMTYTRSGYPAEPAAVIGAPALARGVRLVPLTFKPVRHDAARRTVEVATRIRARVSFNGADLRNVPAAPARAIPASFDRMFRHLVLNYQPPRTLSSSSLGVNVIICPNYQEVVDALARLVEWRQRKGFEVALVTTAETGTSSEAIKAWIQNAYDTWENPPEYITLIGDASGGVGLPCWYDTYSSYHGETDHPYVQLEGDDLLADAHIGRISVDSDARLRLYVEKIVSYESTPYIAETDWYSRACIVGDASTSGYTCIQIGQWLKNRLLERGYTEVDTIFGGAFATQMTTKLNRGDTVFSYRGYYNMSGFNTGHIQGLQNGRKMPFAVNLTCDTGSFAGGTSRSEAWIRAGSIATPPIPTGGIAAIGTATIGTHTRFNNCFTYGIWRSFFWEDGFHFGEGLTRGKYEMYVNYGVPAFHYAAMFTCWNNLMGDPAGEIWTGVPQNIAVVHPSTLPIGANAMTVTVTRAGQPCEGAYACLYKAGETHVGGYTDAAGQIELALDPLTAGTLAITVTKHDHHPYSADITVAEGIPFVGHSNHTLDDDRDGTSSGNSDGLANPTERIEIPVQVHNHGDQTASGVTGTVSTSDPYTTVLDATEDFGEIPAGGQVWCADDFDIEISGGAPDGHVILLGLDLTDGLETWRSLIEVPVVSAAFTYQEYHHFGFGGDRVDPGESGEITVRLKNTGAASGNAVLGLLISGSPSVTVTKASGAYGPIAPGSSAENSFDRYGISVSQACFPGSLIPMRIVLDFSGGAADTVDWVLPVGQAATTDPTGPDGYGYYAFDDTDIGYTLAPTYAWIDLEPSHGGPGVSLGMSDNGDGQDESRTVELPFPFTYYGEIHTRATICSNGWIAMGQTYLTNYRNWNIPGAGAPPNLIAAFWDDLYQGTGSQVYTWYDATQHRFVVHWSRLYNAYNGAIENFEVILYDPTHYGTETGDGMIIFQYETFNNVDGLQHYATMGIQNRTCSDGVLYGYYNAYNRGAAPITSGRAICFAALSDVPRGTLTGTVFNQTNGGTPVAGAVARLVESGASLMTGSDGRYRGAVPAGTYRIAVSHPSFAPDTTGPVTIVAGETLVIDFALQDVVPPIFNDTTDYGATTNTTGPYYVFSTVTEESDFSALELRYNVQGAGWIATNLVPLGNRVYRAAIPGQPYTTLIHYYLYGRDVGGLAGTDPANPPAEIYSFWVMPPTLEDDMEAGPGSWTHEAVTAGYVDQWHLSQQDNHTSSGTWCWKMGDPGTGDYLTYCDAALITEPLSLAGGATLTFWHRMEAEASSLYPGYAYDGGLIEICVDGGDWQLVEPVGGYTHRVRLRPAGPGPFAAETPIFSGTFGWTEVEVDLSTVAGETRFRFRFGSDYAAGGEGWFIDDVLVLGSNPGIASTEGAGDPETLPPRVSLWPNAPNPFSLRDGGTRIGFELPYPTPVSLRIVDPSGRLIRSLAEGHQPAGRHLVLWDGRDGRGRRTPSGVYFYVLEIDGELLSRRMMVLK